MELTPREKDKLLLFTAALVAERRKDRGIKLNLHVFGHGFCVRRQRHNRQRSRIHPHPGPHPDRRDRTNQQAPETGCRSAAFPQHPQKHGAEQRRDEEAE